MSGSIQFSTPIVSATDPDNGRYALDGVLVTQQGDAIATNGRIMAIARCTAANLDKSVVVPRVLGPKATDCGKARYDVNCRKITKALPRKPEATADLVAGRFPAAFDVLPADVGECTVLALDAEYLLDLAKAITAPGERPTVHLLVPPADEKGIVGKAVAVVGSMIGDIQGIGVIMPVYTGKASAADVAVSFEDRRDSLEYLKDAIKAHNSAALAATATAA